jgi:chromosome segregation ATPase
MARSDQTFMNTPSDSESSTVRELQPIVSATETVTQGEIAPPESMENFPTPSNLILQPPEQLAAQFEAARAKCKLLERLKLEADAAADQRLRQVKIEYGNRIIQLEQDSAAERQTHETLIKKIEALENSLAEQTQGMQKIKEQFSEPDAVLAKAKTELEDLQKWNQALEAEAAGLRQERDASQSKLLASQTAAQQAQSQLAELAVKLEQASSELKMSRAGAEENEAARKQLTADLDKERHANKLAGQKVEELSAQIQKLQHTAEQAEARVRESATRCSDLEKKAAELNKTVDELTRNHATEKGAATQSAQRVKELEQQLKSANVDLAASKTEVEKQNSARQRLETEQRNLAQANTKTNADLDKEREAHKLSRQKTEELNTQLKNSQLAARQAEARICESATRCSDLEKKAAELKKTIDELTRNHATEKGAAAQSAQRVKELEQQLKNAGTDLNKEREANKLARQKTEELNTQLKNSQLATQQAETRARESATRSSDLEKKAAELKKTVDELTRNHATEKGAAAQSAQRVKELDQQLKSIGVDLAISKTEVEKQNSTRQRLETENRNLTEASAKAKADLEKEREANKLSRQKTEELNTQLKNLQQASQQAEVRARESAARYSDLEKKAAELKKTADELTRNHAAEKAAAAQSAQRVKELDQQLKSVGVDLAISKTEIEKQNSARQRLEAENRTLTDANAKAQVELAELAKSAAAPKRVAELEQRVNEGVSALARMTAELQGERAERERAEKCASSAAAHLQQVNEKLNRHLETERTSRARIAELEKTIHDRGDALARASASLRKESKERHIAEKQLRLVSEIGTRLETNLGSLEEAKQSFDVALKQKEEQFQAVERSLADAHSRLEKELAERRRIEGLLTDAQRQLEKQSGESKVEIPRLRAALELAELQRKRLEGGLMRSREIATNAEHGQTAMLDSLRRELRQPVEDVRQSACRLLESHVTDEQKRAIETVLEKALFLQVTLNAVAQPDAASPSPANARRADSSDKKKASK